MTAVWPLPDLLDRLRGLHDLGANEAADRLATLDETLAQAARVIKDRDEWNDHLANQVSELMLERDVAQAEVERYRNALKWIRLNAGLHYQGGAFDPEHMRDLAESASSALNGEPVDDFDAAFEQAKVKAREWKERLGI